MRHRVYGKKLNRNKNQRTGLFKSLVQSLFLTGTITTSVSKASAIKGMVDKIITQAKSKDTQRLLQSFLDKDLQERLIKEIVPKMSTRNSGYTSLIRLGTRPGDRTMMVKMSLIGAEELEPLQKKEVKKEVKVKVEKKEEIKKVASTKKVVTRKPVARKTAKKK